MPAKRKHIDPTLDQEDLNDADNPTATVKKKKSKPKPADEALTETSKKNPTTTAAPKKSSKDISESQSQTHVQEPNPDSKSATNSNLNIISQLRAAAATKTTSPTPRRHSLLTSLEEKLNTPPNPPTTQTPPPPSNPPSPSAAPSPATSGPTSHTSPPPSSPPPPGASQATLVPASKSSTDNKTVVIKPPIVVKELAVALGLKPFQLLHHMMELNIFATLTQPLEEEVARKVCNKLGFTLQVEKRDKQASQQTSPTQSTQPTSKIHPPKHPPQPTAPTDIRPRPPIITFMGHVDHGKTSLLDCIRKTKVAAGEAGGITQHIGAYTVEHNGQLITFLDTPGHEAFTAMRARGANITDIAVIVVAADDGIMPQTLEAINHARAAKVAIMVAINKIDLPNANPIKVKSQLQEKGLVPEEYGGDTIVCEVSATKNIGIDHLLEMMLLQAEMLELKADYHPPAHGRIIESQLEQGRGPTATAIVQKGTLKVGDVIICGPYYGRIRALINDKGQNVKTATPSIPVRILGLNGVPTPGESFEVKKDEREARQISEERQENLRKQKLDQAPKITLENIFQAMSGNQKKTLRILLKCDVQGSLEAIQHQLNNIKSNKVDLEIIHAAVGPISETDIMLAKASGGIVIGFNTKTESNAVNAAKRESVQIKLYSIIYELVDQVKEAMSGLLDPELRETIIGTALVKKVFQLSKFNVAGSIVQNGRILRNARARVLRNKQPVYDGNIATLKRFQDDVNEVRSGLECGIRLGNFNEYQENDIIECYQLEKIPQSL
ncbi:MAG: translation initiation factor IF-2 [Methylacidiphilales bacterium]|nr:translation initiation factor IF-2 [Candidatus Methylacidiphilales bacterium]MDW8349191.1 translation initiation factor IF-2 [Verrucomicrobiae bacterium]